ncbi:MAG: HAD family hydrolase [Candidatus Diapherotrites archaeon]|nr:HAD family hydrolase [Candidatus Diapherotrites archaeon]
MLVVFDFDGVLADPVFSIATIAHKAYCKLYHKIPLEFVVKAIRDAKHVLRAGPDIMPVVLLAVEGKNLKRLTREELLEFEKSLGKKLSKLEQAYYQPKVSLRKNKKYWASLFRPHKTALAQFKKVMKKHKVLIATTRHREDILVCFDNWGVRFDENNIVDLRISKDKQEQFRYIRKKMKVPFKRMIFIEDTLWNARAVKKLDVQVLLSTWGLSNKQQWLEAEKLGIKPIKRQSDIYKEIEKIEYLLESNQ